MTVKQLIEELQKMPPGIEVRSSDGERHCTSDTDDFFVTWFEGKPILSVQMERGHIALSEEL